jgi:hypothetical protein
LSRNSHRQLHTLTTNHNRSRSTTTSSNAADSNPNPAATDSFAKPAEIATIVGSIVGFFALVVSVWGVFLVRKKIKERKRRETVREIESSY